MLTVSELSSFVLPKSFGRSLPSFGNTTTLSGIGASAGLSAAQALPAVTTLTVSADAKKIRSGAERALQQLEVSYQRLIDGIQLEHFDPKRIETYIKMAEKRSGILMSDEEKGRLVQASQSNDEQILRLLALQLRVGIPRRLEKEALAAMGELMLNREDTSALKKFAQDASKDPNLQAYVRNLLMMNRVESMMARVDKVRVLFSGLLGR